MSEINFRIVARVIGILLCFEALFMLLPLSVAIYYNESDIYAFLLTTASRRLSDYALHLFLKDIASKWVKERGS